MKSILRTILIVIACFAAGYAIGTLIVTMTGKNPRQEHGYVGKSDIKVEDGEMTPEKADKIWTDYACPPAVTIKKI